MLDEALIGSSEKIEIKTTKYFLLINKQLEKALYIPSGSKKFEEQKALIHDQDQNSLGQVWQVVQVNPHGKIKKDLFQFVHTRSTLVLSKISQQFFLLKFLHQKSQKNQVRLRKGNWSNCQLFYLQQVNPNDFPNVYRFKSCEDSSAYLHFDKYLTVDKIDPFDLKCHWELKPCYENSIINRSCYLQNAYSSLALDVPGGSLSTGCRLIQYPLNNRFNQRFNIYKCGEHYKIRNLSSKLDLSTRQKPMLWQQVTQQKILDEMYQMWSLEYQGKNLYIIRSAINSHLMIGIKDHVIKPQTPIVLTHNQDFALWRIVGFIPQ